MGATAAILFLVLPSNSSVWLLSALLAVSANVGFGASVVAMNAYLPTLAKHSPEVISLSEELENGFDPVAVVAANNGSIEDSIREPLLPRPPLDEMASSSKEKYDIALSNAISRISSLGIALGYSAGILLLILALIPVTKLHGSTFSLRLAIGLSGIWYIFTQ